MGRGGGAIVETTKDTNAQLLLLILLLLQHSCVPFRKIQFTVYSLQFTINVALLCFALVCFAKDGNRVWNAVGDECDTDKTKFCKDVKPGGGRTHKVTSFTHTHTQTQTHTHTNTHTNTYIHTHIHWHFLVC